MKLLYIEHRVYGYILVARRVLYMAGSLRYRGIKHPWFNAHSVQCKNTPYAHCMHSFYVKHTCSQNIVALTMQRIRVETRVFYPRISQRSCSVQHSTCSQNVALHSLFNIQEFQAAFSPLYCTVSKYILHGKTAYSVHTMCSYIAQNLLWITGVLSEDIAAILPCTALYLKPKYSRTVCFQYTRVSNCFFNTTLYCKTEYFTWEKCIQCAYGVFLHGKECALNNGCFIQR